MLAWVGIFAGIVAFVAFRTSDIGMDLSYTILARKVMYIPDPQRSMIRFLSQSKT